MFVTHIREFGKLKYVHMAVDRYSGFLMATIKWGARTYMSQKIKKGEYCPQIPHHSLSHALLLFSFLYVDASEQSATLSQIKWRPLCTRDTILT